MARTEQHPQRRESVLRLLRDLGRPAGTAEVAQALAVHPNTARSHLEGLVETGQAERVAAAPAGRGRPPRMFRATPGMDPTGPRSYRLLAEILASGLTSRPDARDRVAEAGRAWGASRAAPDAAPTSALDDAASIERLVDLLEQLGFAPAVVESASDTDPPPIALHHCPFLELASTRSDLVCPIHLELMRGALESWQAPVRVDDLVPFERPDRCLTHLSSMPPS